MQHPKSFYLINALTLYRLISAPLLLVLALGGQFYIFRWLLLLSFSTDAIDGYLARRYQVASVFGARIDSIADDVTVLAATLSLFYYRPEFIKEYWIVMTWLLVLLLVQNFAALIQYNKVSSFHTYLAKIAAVVQGLFFLLAFFEVGPVKEMFYLGASITSLQLLEEIVLVLMLPEWKSDVRSIFWVLRHKRRRYDSR